MDESPSPDSTPTPGTLTNAVALRARHDGWTPQKQHDFIAALAESGCVAEAAAAVGMTSRSAYRLRARPAASAFRQSWDIALDYAVRNLSDAAFSRALHGVATPVFYQGEQVGERRRYDERLTMFLLRYRDPVRYGAWLDGMEARRHPDGAAIVLANALNVLLDRAHGVVPDPPARGGESGDCGDDGFGDGDEGDDGDRLDPPLAAGPVPPEEEILDPDDPDFNPDDWVRGFKQTVARLHRAQGGDETDDHWQSPFVTRMPRDRRR